MSKRRSQEEPSPERPLAVRGRFILTCVLYLALVGVLSIVFLSDYVFEDALKGLRTAVAQSAGWLMNALGMPISSRGEIIRGPATSLIIVNECTGIDASILLIAAVLVFPCGWRAKLIGTVLSLGVMMVVNFVRVLTLVYIGNYMPGMLEVGHLYVWPVIVIITGVATLMLWADRVEVS